MLASERAAASEGPKEKERGNVTEAVETASAPESDCVSATARPGALNVHYVLYSSIKVQPEPQTLSLEDQSKLIFTPVASVNLTKPLILPPSTAPAPLPRISTAPMTVGEKFMFFARSSFMPPGPYIQSIFTGMWSELFDNNEGKKDTVEDYFADSMTRAARSFGNRAANGFFEKFLYPSILRQDPRYHRSGKTGAGARIGWAISRLFVTRGDRGGSQPNISFLAGGLSGAYVSREWQREEKQDTRDTFRRWGNHVLITGLSNILREFLSGQ
ncbi:MAG TPA: hypothetical protein VF131_28550 [Blastocatellia bacterium]|nr:hypothetical protein [Blastocatellia bacterium]